MFPFVKVQLLPSLPRKLPWFFLLRRPPNFFLLVSLPLEREKTPSVEEGKRGEPGKRSEQLPDRSHSANELVVLMYEAGRCRRTRSWQLAKGQSFFSRTRVTLWAQVRRLRFENTRARSPCSRMDDRSPGATRDGRVKIGEFSRCKNSLNDA